MLRRATALKRICDRQRVQNAKIRRLQKSGLIFVQKWQQIPREVL